MILYKASNDELGASKNMVKDQARKWTYVGYVRAHTHDVRALAMAVPICSKVCDVRSCLHLVDVGILVLTFILLSFLVLTHI